MIGTSVDTTQSMDLLKGAYDNLLADICAAKYGPDNGVYSALISWLESTDFYTAPASSRYHDSCPGGLLRHSLTVYNRAIELHKLPQFSSCSLESITLVSLTHDWCKIGYYEHYLKNVKEDGQWHEVDAYRVNQRGIALGHGVSSMFLVNRFFKLNAEEALAIRWHMGEYNVADNEVNELQLANAHFPLVYLVQFADRLACVEY